MYSLVNFSEETYATRAPFLCADDMLADGVQQMGLAQTDPAVEEQRVVRLAGRLRHRQRGGVGKIVVVADHERVERVLRVETQLVVGRSSFGGWLGRLLLGCGPAEAPAPAGLLPEPTLNFTCSCRPDASAITSCSSPM